MTKKIRIAVNGPGRIGRAIIRAIHEEKMTNDFEIVAINGSAPIETIKHLLKYDSVHGFFNHKIEIIDHNLYVDGKKILLTSERDPKKLNWQAHDIDIVFECTGAFTNLEDASQHIIAGAKKVIISAPAKEDSVKTIVYGVNHNSLKDDDKVISIGSCTTNCLAPMVKILNDHIGIEKGFMTTIHAYTNDQNIVDNTHKDLRRARACAMSMIPTSTGAAKAIGLVLPELKGKLDGVAIRVPTPNVSMVDLNFIAKKSCTAKEINEIIKNNIHGAMKKALAYIEEPLVSIDFNHNNISSNFDATQTKVIGDNLVKVCSWYDNEWAFSVRMLDVAKLMIK
jgi:glyceraldehyde 3-phosphate dehydrogenase